MLRVWVWGLFLNLSCLYPTSLTCDASPVCSVKASVHVRYIQSDYMPGQSQSAFSHFFSKTGPHFRRTVNNKNWTKPQRIDNCHYFAIDQSNGYLSKRSRHQTGKTAWGKDKVGWCGKKDDGQVQSYYCLENESTHPLLPNNAPGEYEQSVLEGWKDK